MTWEVEYTDQFGEWWDALSAAQQEAVAAAVLVLFAFDPLRSAILLLGGNKSGQWDEWYRAAVPLADDLYDEHLAELEREGQGDAKD